MAISALNSQRLTELEELLSVEYRVLSETRKAIAAADGPSQRIGLEEQIRQNRLPRIRKYEQEYAAILLPQVDAAFPDAEAAALIADLREAVALASANQPQGAPAEFAHKLQALDANLSPDKADNSAKLKIAIPIIPTIISYEMEFETGQYVTRAWQKIKEAFRGLFASSPT